MDIDLMYIIFISSMTTAYAAIKLYKKEVVLKTPHMTPKEKAQSLVDKYYEVMCEEQFLLRTYEAELDFVESKAAAKKYAQVTVGEILASFNCFMDSRRYMRHELEIDAERYWQQVKVELENIK